MKNFNVGFLVLLVSTVFLPSINLVYADPIPNEIPAGETIHATEDQVLNGGLRVNPGGELIVDSGVNLDINGVVFITGNGVPGKITVDGTLRIDGLVINFGQVSIRCGEIFTSSSTSVIGNVFVFEDCSENTITITDLVIESSEEFIVPENRILEILGTVIIKEGGVLRNEEITENRGNIILEGGTILNLGTINSYCSNFPDRGITGTGIITGGGTFNDITCDAPIADDDSYSVNEDETLSVSAPGVLDGDTDVDSTTLTSSLLTDSKQGVTMLNSDGSFTYIPDADFFGNDSFEYEVSDGEGGKDVGVVNIEVLPINDAPVADDDDVIVNEDDGFVDITNVVLNGDIDIDSSILSIISAEDSTSAIGQVTVSSLLYNPDGQFEALGTGETGTDTFDYTVSDENGGTATAIVTVTINGQNDAPIADDDSYSVNEDETLSVSAPGVLDGDTDVDSTTLTASLLTDSKQGVTMLNSDGSFTYIPDADFFGNDSFEYEVSDGEGGKDVGVVNIEVLDVIDPDTEPPTITAPPATTVEATSSNTPLSDVELGVATATDSVDSSPVITKDAPEFFQLGQTIVTWTATDASGNSAKATQLVTVIDTTSPIISAPSEVIVTIEDEQVPLSDVELGVATATDSVDSSPVITKDAPEFFQLGQTIVTWTATDASGNSAKATQLVTVEQISISILEQKIEKINGLENMINDATNKKTVKELEKAVKELRKSTEIKKWNDDGNSLDDKKGKKVFKEQEKGIKHILKVLKDGKESDKFIFDLATILLELVGIDETLAINEFNGLDSSELKEKCLDKIEKEFEKAEENEDKEKYDKVVKHYGKVWENSLKANKSKCIK